jgi:CBS domain-containing protein
MATTDLLTRLHQPVSSIMRREVISVGEELGAQEAARLLVERDISGLPVVDGERHPIGVFSRTDLLRDELAQGGPGADATVGDLMTPLSFSLPETASISQAAALMWFEHVHRLPVVSSDNRVVGIVTPMDVLRFVAELDGFRTPPAIPQP